MKGGGWVTLDTKAFLAARGRVVRGTHSWTKRILHWPYCAHCGLVFLRNGHDHNRTVCIRLED